MDKRKYLDQTALGALNKAIGGNLYDILVESRADHGPGLMAMAPEVDTNNILYYTFKGNLPAEARQAYDECQGYNDQYIPLLILRQDPTMTAAIVINPVFVVTQQAGHPPTLLVNIVSVIPIPVESWPSRLGQQEKQAEEVKEDDQWSMQGDGWTAMDI